MKPLVLLSSGTLAAWGAWVFVLLRFDPLAGGALAHSLFYASFAVALQGTLMLAAVLWQRRVARMMPTGDALGILARQVLLFNFFVQISLYLAAHDLLRWWNITPLALLTFMLELFFHSLHRMRAH